MRSPARHCRLAVVFAALTAALAAQQQPAEPPGSAAAAPSLDETRLTLGKWIETQQIIAKERKDWQQGKEILTGRLELVQKEVATLADRIKSSATALAEADRKRREVQDENTRLTALQLQLAASVAAIESEFKKLLPAVPPPVLEPLRLLLQRIPEDPGATRVGIAERYQNVLSILGAINKANTEINVAYEVRNLADGKPAEVKVIYVGLAQAYYVSAGGEAGIGRPTLAGWQWEPSKAVARQVLTALEIKQGKQTPAFVPLPVRIQ